MKLQLKDIFTNYGTKYSNLEKMFCVPLIPFLIMTSVYKINTSIRF